jgi:hypothetical protein
METFLLVLGNIIIFSSFLLDVVQLMQKMENTYPVSDY